MGKILSIIIVLDLASLSYSSIVLTASDIGNCQLQIGYQVTEGTSGPLYLNFDIALSNGATVNGAADVLSIDSQYPVYLDDFDTDDAYPYGGSLPTSSTISVSLGYFVPYEGMGLPGDLNRDGFVNMIDVELFSYCWLGGSLLIGDINDDMSVDMMDYAILATGGVDPIPLTIDNLLTLQLHGNGAEISEVVMYNGTIYDNYGFPLDAELIGTTIVVPEPTTLSLLTLGTITLLKRKRRK